MKAALAAVCVLTLLAAAYLSLSLLVLRPPRATYQVWFIVATVTTVQSVATFVATANSATWLRLAVTAGATALAAIGIWMVRETLASSHFEGYALLLGSILILQAALTLAVFARRTLKGTRSTSASSQAGH